MQYIELVTITALLTVNVAPLFMNIGTTSQIGTYKISVNKSNALFSTIGAITGQGVLELQGNNNAIDYLKTELHGVSKDVLIKHLPVPFEWLSDEDKIKREVSYIFKKKFGSSAEYSKAARVLPPPCFESRRLRGCPIVGRVYACG